MKTTFQNAIRPLMVFAVIAATLVGYSFMSAQVWTGPTGTAPANNVPAPINVGGVYQAKLGDLGAVRMRAGQYCDASGLNCFLISDLPLDVSCPEGQAITAISANGTIVCKPLGTAPTPPETLTYSWTTGPWSNTGGASNRCGSVQGDIYVRTVSCVASNGAYVTNSLCPSPVPATSDERNRPSGCSGD